MNNTTSFVSIGGTIARVRTPKADKMRKLILLLHGWTGDEDSMWIFEPRLPNDAALIAPRGIFPTPLGGFGWQENIHGEQTLVNDFTDSFDTIHGILTSEFVIDMGNQDVSFLGFSQGAALGFSYAVLNPGIFQTAAGLSGFVPSDFPAREGLKPLGGVRIFVAHGTNDELVPVNQAREMVEALQNAGGEVTYCEDDVGHKLSAACFRGLENFYQAN